MQIEVKTNKKAQTVTLKLPANSAALLLDAAAAACSTWAKDADVFSEVHAYHAQLLKAASVQVKSELPESFAI